MADNTLVWCSIRTQLTLSLSCPQTKQSMFRALVLFVLYTAVCCNHFVEYAIRSTVCFKLLPTAGQVVSGKYKGDDKFFALAKYGGKFFAVSEACGRCKFPMVRVLPQVPPSAGLLRDCDQHQQELLLEGFAICYQQGFYQ